VAANFHNVILNKMNNSPPLKSFNKLRFFQNLLALSVVTLIITVWATVTFLSYQNNLLKKYFVDNQSQNKTIISPTSKDISEPQLTAPHVNSVVTSPLDVKGKVPAGWMFEGQFTIQLLDSNKNLIASGIGKEVVPGLWTNGKPVDFEATITFTTTANSGFLILTNDNPSGLPENSKNFEIPIVF
jgi:Immunoglobulin-like domain of bacterial spore germination